MADRFRERGIHCHQETARQVCNIAEVITVKDVCASLNYGRLFDTERGRLLKTSRYTVSSVYFYAFTAVLSCSTLIRILPSLLLLARIAQLSIVGWAKKVDHS